MYMFIWTKTFNNIQFSIFQGLPYPNGKRHAVEIANMAVRLMQKVDGFKVNMAVSLIGYKECPSGKSRS